MDKLSKIQRCYHCGAILQCEDEAKEGYIDFNIINKYPEGFLLCNNCFSTEKFSNGPKEASFDEEYTKVLEEIKRKNALVVYVVNLFSFEGSFINKIIKLLNGLDILVVGNKRDLLPIDLKDEKIKEYVKQKLNEIKLNVLDVVITSTVNKTYGIHEMYNAILKYSNNRDVYFLGASTSGKSALIESLIKNYSNKTNKVITTHKFADTELIGYSIPISDKNYIYETPGTSIDNSILSKIDRQMQNIIIPNESVSAKKVVLNKNTAILFGSLCQVELLSKGKMNAYVYVSSKVNIKTHKNNNDTYFKKQIERNKYQPSSKKHNTFKDFDIYDLEIEQIGKRDIGIAGLGWITIEGNAQTFRISVPKGVYVYTSRSKM